MKTKIILMIAMLSLVTGYSQNTAIPDVNFEQTLIVLGLDVNPANGSVPTANISGVTFLNVSNKNISSLTGIQAFTSLQTLYCYGNPLTSLDVSGLTSLVTLYSFDNLLETSLNANGCISLVTLYSYNNPQQTSLNANGCVSLDTLYCYNNPSTTNPQLTSLNVGGCTALKYLQCYNNILPSLDVSGCTQLLHLYADRNKLACVNVDFCPSLQQLYLFNNELTGLDVSGCPNLIQMQAHNNPNLSCIKVTNVAVAMAQSNWNSGTGTYTTTTCSSVCGVPVPVSSAQTLCDGSKVSQLVATGTSIRWYSSTTGGVSLNSTASLTASTYYVTQTISGVESARVPVIITIMPTPAVGTLSGNQTVCSNATTTFSSTVPGGIWSSNCPGIVAVDASTGVVTPMSNSGTCSIVYTVTGSNGCIATTKRNVTITPAPATGTLSGTQVICSNGSATFSSTVSGGTWTSSNISVAGISSTGVITPFSAGSTTMTYTTVNTHNGCTATATRTLTVIGFSTAGNITPAVSFICVGSSITLNLNASIGSPIQWQSSTNAVSGFSTVQTGGTSFLATPAQTMYYRVVIGTAPCQKITKVVKISVLSLPSAGVIKGGGYVCFGTLHQLSVTGFSGFIQWQSSTDGTNFTDITGVTSATYSPYVSQTLWYRVRVSNALCSVYSSAVEVRLKEVNPGIISGYPAVCYGTSNPLTVSGCTYGTASATTFQWERSTNNISFSTITNAQADSYITPTLTSTTYYRVKVSYDGCSSYAYFTVNIFPQITIGTISSNPASPVCYNTSTTLTLSGTYPAGTTFKWFKKTVLSFATILAPILGAEGQGQTYMSYTTGNLTTATSYQVQVTDPNGCIKTALINVTVKPKPPITIINGSTIVCYGAGSTLTLANLPKPSTVQWQSSTDGVTFSTIAGATTLNGSYTPTNLTVTTYYQALITFIGCPYTTNIATITVTPPAILGPITGNTTVCYNGSTLLTAPSSCSGALYQWQVSNHNGPFFPILGATSATYTAVLAGHDTSYKVTVKCPGGCGCLGITPVITVSVGAFIETGTIAITSGSNIVCSGDSTTVLTLSGNVGTIVWHSSTDNFVTNDTTLTTSPTITVEDITTTTYYRAVVTNTDGCSAPSDVQVINIAPIPQLTVHGRNQVCSNNAATITVSGYQPTSSFEWQSSNDGITWNYVTNGSGFTTDSYTTPNLISTTYYRVLVNTPYACYSFSPAHTVTVVPNDLIGGVILLNGITAPTSPTIIERCSVNGLLNLSINNPSNFDIQWMVNATGIAGNYTALSGETSPAFSLSAATMPRGAFDTFYTVQFTSQNGCVVRSPSIRVHFDNNCKIAMSTSDKFNVVSSPNPFISNFNLNLTTSSLELVQIKVYDMLGKLVEEQEVKPIDVSALKIGTSNYPSGVYNVIVTQGAEKKTLRVIKN